MELNIPFCHSLNYSVLIYEFVHFFPAVPFKRFYFGRNQSNVKSFAVSRFV
jgi:hypothetical protein